MEISKSTKTISKVFIGISALSVGYVAIFSLISPQATMDLVGTTLPNTDALSSIRGIYGGVGIVLAVQLLYLLLKDFRKGLLFLSFFWGAYALSRLITHYVDGPLGEFGMQWIMIETVFCLLAVGLFWATSRQAGQKKALQSALS